MKQYYEKVFDCPYQKGDYSFEPVDMTEIERNKRVVEHLLKSEDVNDYYYIRKIAKGDFDNE